jgi:hypothetical protein
MLAGAAAVLAAAFSAFFSAFFSALATLAFCFAAFLSTPP